MCSFATGNSSVGKQRHSNDTKYEGTVVKQCRHRVSNSSRAGSIHPLVAGGFQKSTGRSGAQETRQETVFVIIPKEDIIFENNDASSTSTKPTPASDRIDDQNSTAPVTFVTGLRLGMDKFFGDVRKVHDGLAAFWRGSIGSNSRAGEAATTEEVSQVAHVTLPPLPMEDPTIPKENRDVSGKDLLTAFFKSPIVTETVSQVDIKTFDRNI